MTLEKTYVIIALLSSIVTGFFIMVSMSINTKKPVVASGGISSLADIAALSALHEIGVEGAIVGKALYAGAFTLQEALTITKGAK